MIAFRKRYRPFFSIAGLSLLSLVTRGQATDGDSILARFTRYQQDHLPEKLYVHTDKDFYVCGEILWFKIYAADGFFNRPLALSKLAYVEIIGPGEKPVLQASIAMEGASGSGSFQLPASLPTGNYLLRAYTNWMKNTGAGYFFEKPVTIVNTFRVPDLPDTLSQGNYQTQFFPEGGNLVSGLENRVAFYTTDPEGNGVTASGFIVDQFQDTVVRFKSFHAGMGSFSFTPARGRQYKALVRADATPEYITSMPPVFDQGYVMQVREDEPGFRQVIVRTRTGNDPETLLLLVHTRGVTDTLLYQICRGGTARFQLDERVLRDGISQLTLFNGEGQPVCERLVFKRPSRLLLISAQTDQPRYHPREKVRLNVGTGSVRENADLSIAVLLVDSLQQPPQEDILTYLWLRSDLKGRIESPAYYFMDTRESAIAADNLMMTQGWRRFKWEDILTGKKSPPSFLPEYGGPVISGKLSATHPGQHLAGTRVFLTIPGERFSFAVTEADADGAIRFAPAPFFGSKEMIVQTNSTLDSGYQVSIASPFSVSYFSSTWPPFRMSEQERGVLTRHSIGTQVQNRFESAKKQQFNLPAHADTSVFFEPADHAYMLDDYTRFTTMEEVIREYVAGVSLRNANQQPEFRIRNTPYMVNFSTDPLVLLDGMPIFDMNRVMTLDPLKIKRLEVVARKYYVGPVANNGILSLTSYEGDMGGFQLDPGALVLHYPGAQLPREFYMPAYEQEERRASPIPDFRNLLYWNPQATLAKDEQGTFTFYTSDLPGQYVIFVQGISKDGRAGSTTVRFDVQR